MNDKKAGHEVEGIAGAKRSRSEIFSCNSTEVPEPEQGQLPPGLKAIQEAVSNDLILKCIFKYFRTRDLVRDCRLVNTKWNRVATETLKKRSDAFVKVNGKTNFELLETSIKNSPDFPFREIDLTCIPKDFDKSPEKWSQLKLFREHGDIFSRLRLSLIEDLTRTGLVTLLSGPLNKIQNLTIGQVTRYNEKPKIRLNEDKVKSESVQEVVHLEQLKTVKFQHHHDSFSCHGVDPAFLTWIWHHCPKVEEIHDIPYPYLPGVSAVGKLGAVKSLVVSVCSPGPTSGMVAHPHLPAVTTMSMLACYHYAEGREPKGPFLLQLLDSYKSTLKNLKFYWSVSSYSREALVTLVDLALPQLDCLHLLRYNAVMWWQERGLDIPSVFPALKNLRIEHDQTGDYVSVEESLGKTPIVSVIAMELCAYIVPSDWKVLSRLCPNVSSLRIDFHGSSRYYVEDSDNEDWDDSLSCSGQKYWDYQDPNSTLLLNPFLAHHFDALKKLEIYNISLPGDLDVLLTGFSMEDVKELRSRPPLQVNADFLAFIARRYGGIVSFKGLKELVMSFTMSDSTTPKCLERSPVMTHVAVDYGFKLVPEMKITFLYDFRCKNANLIRTALEPATQFVKFGHRDVKEPVFV